ncbi:cell division protein SepF [Streptomonospora sp. S1-112]|jgi:cell division inhibitor SepF|uniref:Cell division protein SepF n=2 Tax=Streptomonospora TaxID=104204 RepID=A0A853BJQ8_9ACTN|nr:MULTISPECIES: cell division protein SepF [Streptomonospora]MBV2362502.1 cell division protein SepF [Streptomonospora nanhaiensis]MBX9389336.1 cell division protein SepF [Streptomonospora nanhaiensis]MDA0567044.1 cell division protein SepF [Streptomonospora mangrovi]NYI94837.1 cell division inhibitor SepF [Streptomonospora nanhaiensis]
MAGAMRKMAVYLGLVEDDRYDHRYADEYDDFDDFEEGVEGRRDRDIDHGGDPRVDSMTDADDYTMSPSERRIPTHTTPATADLARITTLHPRTYNEARTIGEHFREGIPVIMNLTEMVDSDAKRLVDFAAGLIFGLHGSIERVTNKVFLLSPANVEVTAEDKARIAERGFFNQS